MHHITTAGLNARRPKCSPNIQRRGPTSQHERQLTGAFSVSSMDEA